MKRTLAITAVTAVLALSLAACGAERSGTSGNMGGVGGTTATDTMRNNDGQTGTGTAGGASTNTDAAKNGLGTVTGALNSGREPTRYGLANGGAVAYDAAYLADVADSEEVTPESRYRLMMENARVHDRDGFLLDGENSSYRTF